VKKILILLLLSAPALAQQQNFQIDPLELSDCLPRWDRNMAKSTHEHRVKIRQQLQSLMKYEKDPEETAILLHRLAVNYYLEYEAYRAEGKAEKAQKHWLAESIRFMTMIIQERPRYKKLDEVYILLGEALWTAGREKDALQVLKSFIKNYPTSSEMPRAYFFFAEFYFKEQQYDRAVIFFQKADSLGPSDYSYCLSHRIAYCYYKLGKTTEAVEWLNKANELRSGGHQGQVE